MTYKINANGVDDELPSGKHPHTLGLGSLFFITVLCAAHWSVIGWLGGSVMSFMVSFFGLGFLGWCVLRVASGHVGYSTRISLSIAVLLMCLALEIAFVESLTSH